MYKMKNFKLPLLSVLAITILAAACTTKPVKNANSENTKLISAYLEVKDALVKTEASLASTAAATFVNQLKDSEDDLILQMKNDAIAISNSSDIEEQRRHFNTFSQSMYNFVKQAKSENSGLYKQYCPMAFNNTGAFWLASEEEINNPFFGSKMLKCGVVKESL